VPSVSFFLLKVGCQLQYWNWLGLELHHQQKKIASIDDSTLLTEVVDK
jgi:hypothetical protein|tara:strand:- start:294 stop:437 length:144 start_codon:yes stop_codon:yes gene_type:complete